MINNIIALWSYLGKGRRWQFFLLFILTLSSIFLEAASIGAIVPFLGALTDPEALMELDWFHSIIDFFGFQSGSEILLPMTMLFVIITVLSSGARILLLWMNIRLTADMAIQLRKDLYTGALYQPYEYHMSHNSSKLISLITEKIGVTINTGIMHVLHFITALVMSIAIMSTLLLLNSFFAISMFAILGGGYFLMGYLTRTHIRQNGEYIAQNQPKAVQNVQEGLGSIRDIIVDSSQNFYIQMYYKIASKIQIAGLKNAFLSMLPKYLLEMVGLILIAVLAYYLQTQVSGNQLVLPILGAMALGVQRLLPSLQQIYLSWSTINGATPILSEVLSYLYQSSPSNIEEKGPVEPLEFKNHIALKNVKFRYQGLATDVLDNIDIDIPTGSRIGFIGYTGSGKSTLLDIIMGLLPPSQGKLIVDTVMIDKDNIRNWQANIAHVPQNIYLSDASIYENIALGVSKEDIDHNRVRYAAQQANIDKYIEDLSNGYETTVGERGVQMSGGQRQRLGIARALYKQSKVIIFDEATSALDNTTEEIVMQAIESLGKDYTVLMIAHRLSTLKGCDKIYKLDHGTIIASGTYNEMISL